MFPEGAFKVLAFFFYIGLVCSLIVGVGIATGVVYGLWKIFVG